jgi:sensor histidine kinase YesM
MIQGYLKHEYRKFFKDKTYNTESVVLSSVNQNLNFILKEFIQIAAELSIDDNLCDLIKDYERSKGNSTVTIRDLTNSLSRYSQYTKWIENISIASKDGLIFQYDRKKFVNYKFWNEANIQILKEINDRILSLMEQNTIPRYLAMSYNLNHPGHETLYLFHIAVPLKGDGVFDEVEHTVIVSFNTEVMGKFLNSIHQNSEGIATGYITDETGTILYHRDDNYIGIHQEKYLKQNDLQNISETIGKLGWKINIAIDENKMEYQMNQIYFRGTVFYIAVLFLVLAFLFLIKFLVLKPVNEIYRSIQAVRNGNLNNKILIEGKHEIWKLAMEYNDMIESLNKMNEQVETHHREKLLSIKKQQRAEREALESQINAHFICNTLGAINYEVMESGNHKVSVLVKKLSNILRYTFDQKQQNVYMFQELAWIEQYLYLQKYRLEDVFDYVIDFPERFESLPCRKLMLQPFVENSILHGFEGLQTGGMITIKGEAAGKRLKLSIEDNGAGMDLNVEKQIREIIRNPLEANKEKLGIGISNVITRMYMYYGEDMDVELKTSPNKGVQFIFYLPLPIER